MNWATSAFNATVLLWTLRSSSSFIFHLGDDLRTDLLTAMSFLIFNKFRNLLGCSVKCSCEVSGLFRKRCEISLDWRKLSELLSPCLWFRSLWTYLCQLVLVVVVVLLPFHHLLQTYFLFQFIQVLKSQSWVLLLYLL